MAMLGVAPFAGGLLAHASTFASGLDLKPDISSRERMRERYFPNVLLTTHEGKQVRFYDDLIKDKIVLINMMYAKCEGVCPGITTNLVKVQRLLGDRVGKDIFMCSITLKPEQDTPQVLKTYAEGYKVGPGWNFLTGDPAEIEMLRRKLGFTNPDPVLDADKSQHIGMVWYGNEPLQQWAACPGLAKASFIADSVRWVDWPKDAAKAKEARKGGQK
jgi:protein SCO1/2